MKIRYYVIIVLSISAHNLYPIIGDFGRRYGANSRLLQRPLYFKEYTKKKCVACTCKTDCCTKTTKYIKN